MKVSQLLTEADVSRPLELHDVVKFFPNTYKKVFAAKWGKVGSLTYHGHPFFANDAAGEHDIGSAYEGIDGAVEDLVNDDDFKIEVNLTMDLSDFESDSDTMQFDSHDFSFDCKVSEKQEVYLGYSVKENCLYAGYDAWIREEEFNDAWDKEFENATGEMFDMDNPEHDKVFQKVWQKFRDEMFFGMLFRITERNGNWHAEEHFAPMMGGFYKGVYRGLSSFHSLDLIDLRLD
jgi:hypothetical protein